MELVELQAQDKTLLAGALYKSGKSGIILLHQYRQDKESWSEFATALQQIGHTVLAIDLRGHGKSQGKYEAFIDKNFQDMLLDAQAAAKFLRSKGCKIVAIMGASIGANTAFRFSADNNIPAVLLSPGLLYHGIDINDVTSRAPTLTIVAKEDEYSMQSSKELDENNMLGRHELFIVEGKEHGTDMLPNCKERILEFLKPLKSQSS